MRKTKRKSREDWVIGRWHASAGQIDVVFAIDKTASGFRIEAADESDGERLVVSNVTWDGKVLSFETCTPSNKWRTKNRFKVISKSKAIQELTFWEPWEKLPPEPADKATAQGRR
jgi:hypothetical protein